MYCHGSASFYMSTLDGGKTYTDIKAKVEAGERLSKQDLMSIVFLPMMSYPKQQAWTNQQY